MAQSEKGGRARRRNRSQALAAYMAAHNIVRTTGRCAVCYRIITIDGPGSHYNHICK